MAMVAAREIAANHQNDIEWRIQCNCWRQEMPTSTAKQVAVLQLIYILC